MNARMPTTLAYCLAQFAPPTSEVHRIVADDRFLQADLEILNLKNSGELERRREREAMYQQHRYQDQIGREL